MTSAERAVERRSGALPDFPTLPAPVDLDERLRAVDPTVALPRALLVSTERAAWLGARLAEQIEREGVHGVVGTAYTVTAEGRALQTGEYGRALFEAERREREHMASLIERCARLGIAADAKSRDSDLSYWLARIMRELLLELGEDTDDPEILRKAKAAFARTWQARSGSAWTPAEQRSYFGNAGMPDAAPPV